MLRVYAAFTRPGRCFFEADFRRPHRGTPRFHRIRSRGGNLVELVRYGKVRTLQLFHLLQLPKLETLQANTKKAKKCVDDNRNPEKHVFEFPQIATRLSFALKHEVPLVDIPDEYIRVRRG